MDGPIERVLPGSRILPARPNGRRREQEDGDPRFQVDVDAEAQPCAPDEERKKDTEHPVGHAPDDEAGARVDLTA